MPPILTRRRTLLAAGAALVLGPALPGLAHASAAARDRLMAFTGGAEPEEGRIDLDLPDTAENASGVRLELRIDSPMTEDDHIRRVIVLAEANRTPEVAIFHLSPLSGEARLATRIRLAAPQTVTVVAETSTGRFYSAARAVELADGGCVM